MSEQSWRDAYALRNKVIEQRGINAQADANSVADAVTIANAGFRDSLKADNSVPLSRPLEQPKPLNGDGGTKQLKDDAYKAAIEKGGFGGFMATVGQALDKPVIKQVVDGLSTGTYTMANIASDSLKNGEDGARKVVEDIHGGKNPIEDILATMANQPKAAFGGLVKGVSAGFGNEENKKTFGTVIKEQQKAFGVPDNELDGGANGAVQGWGGLAADIAFDPLTYLTLGTAPFAKGLIKGAVEGGNKAKNIAKLKAAKSLDETGTVAPELTKIAENPKGRIGTAIQEAVANKQAWDAKRFAEYQAKKDIKALKKDKASNADGLSVGSRDYIPTMDPAIAAREALTVPELKAAEVPAFSDTPAPKVGGMQDGMKVPELPPTAKIETPVDVPIETVPIEKTPEQAIQEVTDAMAGKKAASNEVNLEDLLTAPTEPLVSVANDAVAKTAPAKAMEAVGNGDPVIPVAPKMTYPELQAQHDALNSIVEPLGAQRNLSGYLKSGNAPRPVMRKLLDTMGVKYNGEIPPAQSEVNKAIDGFIALRSQTKKDLASAKKEVLAKGSKKPTRKDEVLAGQKAEIDTVKNNVADVADEMASNPAVFDETAQALRRRNEFGAARATERDLMLSDPEMKVALKGDATVLPNLAHEAVVAAIEKQTAKAAYKTKGKFNTNTQGSVETGGAWKPERWGTNSQIALHSTIINKVAQIVNDANLPAGVFRTGLKKKLYMSALKIADKELRAAGVEPFLNYVSASGNKINLSLYDVLSSVDAYAPKALIETLFTSGTKGFKPTDFANAVEHLMYMRAKNIPEDKIRARVRSSFTAFLGKNGSSSQTVHGRPDSNTVTRGMAEALTKQVAEKNKLSPVETARYVQGRANIITDALMLPKVYEELSMRSVINHAMHNSAVGKYIDDLSSEAIIDLASIASTSSTGEALGFIDDVLRDLRSQFSPEDLAKAKVAFDIKLATIIKEPEKASLVQVERRTAQNAKITPPAKAKEFINNEAKIGADGKTNASKIGERNAKAGPPTGAAVRAQEAINSTHVKEVQDAAAEVAAAAPKPVDGVLQAEKFEMVAAEIATAAMRKIHPIQLLVNPKLGLTDEVYRAVNSGLHSIARQQNVFHSTLLHQMEQRGHVALTKDFTAIQTMAKEHLAKNGMDVPFTLPKDIDPGTRDMFDIMNVLFDTSLRNVYARNGIGAAHFNSHLEAAGLRNENWRFATDASHVNNSQLWTQWEGIEKHGVLDFMSKIHGASVKAAQDISIAASFSKNFGETAYKPGLVKLAWTDRPKNSSSIYSLIDSTLYYPKEVAAQIRGLDKLMYESRSISTKNNFGKFIVNVFDPVTNALKASQTTVRPGHWSVSVAGDLLRNQIAGVHSVMPYKHAVEIMRAAKLDPEEIIGGFKVADMSKVQRSIAQYKKDSSMAYGFDLTAGDGKGVPFYINGKKVKIQYKDLGTIVNDGIAIPQHRGGGGGALEDRLIDENVTSRFAKGLSKATDAVTDNKHFSLNKGAAARDNFMRIALAVDYASKRKWKSVDEMKAGMEDYVTKWAPLSTDFTAFEAKYARRTMLYYTWLRGITPRIIDAAMTKPGVSTAVPKALYNMALANGLHPESIGNPFDPDKLFPDYYSKNILGPQWQNDSGTWGFNPSSPVIEVADSLFAGINPMHPVESAKDSAKTLFGMGTPFIKAPTEMFITKTSNGIPIKSDMQYLLDNFGGSYASTLSRATGKTIGAGGIVDRTDSAHKDTPEDQANHALLQALNFTTGGKVTDYQSTGAQKSAIYSAQQEAKARAGR